MDSSDSVCRILPTATRGRTLSAYRGPLNLTWGVVAGLTQRLHIGANDITNPADFGVAVDFVDAGPFLAKAIPEGFDCDVESDFAPEFKTVGDGFRSRIDTDCDALHLMFVDSLRE
jgi:hypothetical protein